MPDAIITATASTFGTITGTFAADQSTITGTVSGTVVGTLTGSVGVPGPAGPAGPGSTWGGIVGTLSDQTDLQSALDAKQNVSGMSAYLTKAGNLTGLTDLATARDNLGLGSLSTPTFAGVNVPGSGTSVANLGATFLTINQQGSGQFTIQPSQGIVFPDATIQTTAYPGPAGATAWGTITGTLSSQTDLQTALNLKAPLASPVFTGDARAVTAALGDNDTSIATTAFVQQELLSGTANARNLEVYVRNQTGSTIPAGSIVYINGATGNRPTITLAQANNDANSAQTFGFVKAAIANNGFGFVIVRGELENINTSALTEGVQLYLSPTTPGTWTTTKPSAPQHLVYVGICVRAHPTQGVILVAVQNGYEVGEIHDIQLGTLANNDLLAYESSTDLWKNKTFGALGLLTSSSLTGYATESWVTSQGYLTASALTGYATESWVTSQGYLTDAPSDGNQYARKDGAWDVVSVPASYITSVSSPLSVTSGDLSIDLSSYLTSATAASTYQTLSGMSSYLTTSAAASTYAPLASPALTGNVTITTNSTSPALFIEQSGTGNILTLHDQASDTTFVAIDQNGKVNTIASTTANAGFNVPHGTAPTTPVNGDLWTTTSGLFMRQNGSTQQYVDFGGTQTISGAKTFSNANLTLGNAIGTGTINLGSGATTSGSTKTINIGTSGVSGSTTTITIGTTTGPSTTALNGTVSAGTQPADTNSTVIATTQFVIGQAGSATPLVNGTAAVGTSLRYARQDHVHGTDTTRAALASPTFTGTPAAPTAAVDTNTTQLATTAYVVGQGYLKSATASSTYQTISGMSSYLTTASAASTYAPLASPAFTGTPSLPTGTTAVTQTAGNNTTAVATTAFVTAAIPAVATTAQIISPSSTTAMMTPDGVRQMLMFPGFQEFYGGGVNATSGAGAVLSVTGNRVREFGGPNAGVAGYSTFVFDTTTSSIGFYGSVRGGSAIGKNFNRRFWFGSRAFVAFGDANNLFRSELGGRNLVTTSGDPVQQGIGWKVAGGGGNAIVFYLRTRSAGNGGTYIQTTTTFTPLVTSPRQWFDWYIVHDGASTSQMYVNDTLVGTLTASFSGFQEEFNFYSDRIEQTASAATRMEALQLPTRVFFSQ